MNKEMEGLFKRAKEEGLWFWCHYQDLWFSPDELRKAQADGRFRWGAVNWKLRDPREQVKKLERQAAEKLSEANSLRAVLAKS